MGSLDLVESAAKSPRNAPVSGEKLSDSRPIFAVSNGVAAIVIPEELFASSDPLWKDFLVGYFIGDTPHVGLPMWARSMPP